jgi:hypothetical protein
MMLSGCGNTTTDISNTEDETTTPAGADEAMMPETTDETAVPICDENGNVYASEEAAAATGLSEAEYGATYCSPGTQMPELVASKTTNSATTTGQKAAVNKTKTTTETPNIQKQTTTTTVATDKEVAQKTTTENYSKEDQITGAKKHDDFILEHVKHHDMGDKYSVTFELDREHDAKTHAAPYTIAKYHAHDSKNDHGRIEVTIHDVDKSKFDSTKIIEPKHNKFVQDIEMVDSENDNHVKFIVHLEKKASGKYNLSSGVENNQDATVTLDILE